MKIAQISESYRGHRVSATPAPAGGWTARVDLIPVGDATTSEGAIQVAKNEVDRLYREAPPPVLTVIPGGRDEQRERMAAGIGFPEDGMC